jgi:hypothetical protein
MVICLRRPLPATSSGLPAACPAGVGHTSPLIWPCSDWGLPCRRCCQRRGGLLPHRFTLTRRLPAWRSVFCGPVRRLPAPRRYLAVYPLELGLSSDRLAASATTALDQPGKYKWGAEGRKDGRREGRKDGKSDGGKGGMTESRSVAPEHRARRSRARQRRPVLREATFRPSAFPSFRLPSHPASPTRASPCCAWRTNGCSAGSAARHWLSTW